MSKLCSFWSPELMKMKLNSRRPTKLSALPMAAGVSGGWSDLLKGVE